MGFVVDMSIEPPYTLIVKRLKVRGSVRESSYVYLRPDEVEVLLEIKQ